jgi:hypothetical protein
MKINWKEIDAQIEQLKETEDLRFRIPATFGGGVAIIALNPNFQKSKGEHKYILKLGNNEEHADQSAPYHTTDKTKILAKWVADRLGDPIN